MSEDIQANHTKSKKTHILLIIICTSLITVTFAIIGLWWALQHFSAPSILKYTGYADSFVIKKPNAEVDLFTLHMLGELVMNGTLMSIDDLWSFQSSFYQTIVSVLIAINAILAVFAFVFVKISSHDKAVDSAIEHTQKYIDSLEFKQDVNKASESILEETKNGFESTAEEFSKNSDLLFASNQDHLDKITYMEKEQAEMKRQLHIMASKIAENDKSEKDGQTLELRL